MQKRILAIYGSPRKGGNTDLMLDAFLDGAAAAGAESKRVYVRDLEIHGCLGCGYCDKHGRCVQQDGMTEVYELIESADRIVVASPIYFYGVTGQLKLLIDRSQALYMKQDIARKEGRTPPSGARRRGFLLCAGATRGKRLFDCAILAARYFYDAVDADYAGDLCFKELDERGAVTRHPDALDECRKAGLEFVS